MIKSDSSDSDCDLPDPDTLFDSLLKRNKKSSVNIIQNQQTLSSSPSTLPTDGMPFQAITTPVKEQAREGRRSSPRLKHQQKIQATSSIPPRTAEFGAKAAINSVDDVEEEERRRHTELANELFPPSPPSISTSTISPPPASVSKSRSSREFDIIPDSDVEAGTPRRDSFGEMDEQGRPPEKGFIREGTVISDSELEGQALPEKCARNGKIPRRRTRISTTFNLDSSEEAEDMNPTSRNRKQEPQPSGPAEEGRESLAESLKRLNIASSSTPRSSAWNTNRSRSKSPTKPPTSRCTPPTRLDLDARPPDCDAHVVSTTHTRLSRQPGRKGRRITISIVSDSSSSSSSEDEDDRAETKSRSEVVLGEDSCASGSERNSKPSTSWNGTAQIRDSREVQEVIVIETDDEDEADIVGGVGEDVRSIMPLLEPEIRINRNDFEIEESRRGGYLGMEDVWENDGMLIYDPTPKKRPVKISTTRPPPLPSPSPFQRQKYSLFTPSRGRNDSANRSAFDSTNLSSSRITSNTTSRSLFTPTQESKRRIEIDLTGSSSSSEEDDSDAQPTASRNFPSSHKLPATPSNKGRNYPSATTSKPIGTSTSKVSTPVPSRTPKPKPKKKASAIDSPANASSFDPLSRPLTKSDRTELPLQLIRQIDKRVFRKKWSETHPLECLDSSSDEETSDRSRRNGRGLPEGLEVVWNNRLRNTAGRARWKKVKSSSPSKPGSLPKIRHQCTVELSAKVIDTPYKLRSTLAHELCHIAAWVLSNEVKPPHGGAFKLWGKRIEKVFKDERGFKVETTHNYQIEYKFRWKCEGTECGKIFGRHSNSINPSTHGCPCGSKLVRIDKDGNPKKVPATTSFILAENERGELVETPVKGQAEGAPTKKKNEWLEFVATQSPIVRRERPEIPQSEVFKVVAEKWKRVKEDLARQTRDQKEKDKTERDQEKERELEQAMTGLKV